MRNLPPYDLAYAAAQLDAEMVHGATIEDEAENRRFVLRARGEVIGFYPYRR